MADALFGTASLSTGLIRMMTMSRTLLRSARATTGGLLV
jgi:hypothetical protein